MACGHPSRAQLNYAKLTHCVNQCDLQCVSGRKLLTLHEALYLQFFEHQLKTPYNDGTTDVIFEPLDFMCRMYGMPRAQGCTGAAIARLVARPN